MNRFLSILVLWALVAIDAYAQGEFIFANATSAYDVGRFTRVGSIDGPFAGPDFWAQMLAGQTVDSLTPIDVPVRHSTDYPGWAYGGVVEVPGSPPYTYVYVQMVAWDGRRWGSDLAGVPPEWLGRTDVVQLQLGGFPPDPRPLSLPFFTQPAIVPIPEPSALVFLALGTMVLWAPRFFRGARPAGSGAGLT